MQLSAGAGNQSGKAPWVVVHRLDCNGNPGDDDLRRTTAYKRAWINKHRQLRRRRKKRQNLNSRTYARSCWTLETWTSATPRIADRYPVLAGRGRR